MVSSLTLALLLVLAAAMAGSVHGQAACDKDMDTVAGYKFHKLKYFPGNSMVAYAGANYRFPPGYDMANYCGRKCAAFTTDGEPKNAVRRESDLEARPADNWRDKACGGTYIRLRQPDERYTLYTTPQPQPKGSANSADPADPELLAALQRHNELRKLHSAAPVPWNNAIATGAQKYAELCKIGVHDAERSNNITSFESLAWDTSVPANLTNLLTAVGATDRWYSEVSCYDYQDPEKSTCETGHFQSIVWKSVISIGCGFYRECPDNIYGGRNIWNFVCRYEVAGKGHPKYIGLSPTDNVFPKVSS